MAYPQVLLVPLMLLADYFLTVLGAVQRQKVYAEHFRTQHYELNPVWQQSIARKQWFNPRHVLLVLLVSAVLVLVAESGYAPLYFVDALLGAIFAVYGLILARHLSNLFTFGYINHRPGEISGGVSMSQPLVISMSLYQCLQGLIPVSVIAVFAPSWFALGAVSGMVALLIVHLLWLQKARRHAAPAQGATDSPS